MVKLATLMNERLSEAYEILTSSVFFKSCLKSLNFIKSFSSSLSFVLIGNDYKKEKLSNGRRGECE